MNDQSNVAVTLSVYEWHQLLSELEHLIGIVNRDKTSAWHLYKSIANQLSNGKVNFVGDDQN